MKGAIVSLLLVLMVGCSQQENSVNTQVAASPEPVAKTNVQFSDIFPVTKGEHIDKLLEYFVIGSPSSRYQKELEAANRTLTRANGDKAYVYYTTKQVPNLMEGDTWIEVVVSGASETISRVDRIKLTL